MLLPNFVFFNDVSFPSFAHPSLIVALPLFLPPPLNPLWRYMKVRLKAELLDKNSNVNLEATTVRREAAYYFDLHDLDASGDIDADELPSLLER